MSGGNIQVSLSQRKATVWRTAEGSHTVGHSWAAEESSDSVQDETEKKISLLTCASCNGSSLCEEIDSIKCTCTCWKIRMN